jgi:transcriptional regulator with XRE-family HTH domain
MPILKIRNHNLGKVIGSFLQRIRQEQRLSLNDAAHRIGVTFQQLQKYEAGANRITIERFAEYCLNLSPQLNIHSIFNELATILFASSDLEEILNEKEEIWLKKSAFHQKRYLRMCSRLLELDEKDSEHIEWILRRCGK